MSQQGDLHNFGQSVQPIERASGSYFRKPRPIYWEWLFFGKTSPLAPFFSSKTGEGPITPGDCLFHLDIEMDEMFTGYSRRVVPAASEIICERHAYSFGVLLAYSYVFGIRDLHRHNIIQTESHLQVVDAEVVLVKILLPNETLLLPFKDIKFDLAAISHLGQDQSSISHETLVTILKAYCETFECILKNQAGLQRVFDNLREELIRVPVRHIMRDTVRYRKWKAEEQEVPFCFEELEQLERGDIPYFFKFVGDKTLYRYTNDSGSFTSVSVPVDFRKDVARDASEPNELLDRGRLEKNLFPTGLLFLASRLAVSAPEGCIKFGDILLHIDHQKVTATVGGMKFQSSRQ
jgi:hypothetical protein